MKISRVFGAWLVALLLVRATLLADDRTFDAGFDAFGNPGPNPTSWGASENWAPNGVPVSADSATFDNRFFQILPNVHLDGTSYVADSLYVVFGPSQGEWRLGANGIGGTSMSATLTLTSGFINRSDSNNASKQIIGATSGTGLLTGAVMTLATAASGFTIQQVDLDGELEIAAIISGTNKTLTKSGAGLLTISRASTFTGATMIGNDFDGQNTLNAAADGALGNTASISLDSGASLLLSNAGASDRIGNNVPIRLGGPTYNGIPVLPPAVRRAGGGNEGLGNTIGLGVLTLTAPNALLDYGGDTTGNGTLTYADFVANENCTLLVRGYQGVFGTAAPGIDGTNDRLIFATDQTNNLLRFQFVHPNGMNGTFHAAQVPLASGFYEIVPAGAAVSTFQVGETDRDGNNFVLKFLAMPGQRYRVKASANLLDAFPSVIATIPPSEDYVVRQVTDSNALSAARRFYLVFEIAANE